MARPSDTRERILVAARDLFIARGVQQTSLREIAERLGISKPALYYHFDSREALLQSIVLPLIDACNDFIASNEAVRPLDARALLAGYFDLLQAHREVLTLLVRDLSTLGALGLGARLLDSRRRLIALLSGSQASVADRVRATIAIGGLSDSVVEFAEEQAEKIKDAAVEAACGALGLQPSAPSERKRTSSKAVARGLARPKKRPPAGHDQ